MKILNPLSLVALSYFAEVISTKKSHSQPEVITKLDGSDEYSEFEEIRTPFTVKYNEYLVVTPLDVSGASEFYQKTRNSGCPIMDPKVSEEKLSELKSYICASIIMSPLFQKRYQCAGALDMQDNSNYDKMLHDYPNIFKMHQSGSESAKNERFVNPYVPRDVAKSQLEEVFACFAQKRSKDVAPYFISREYVTEGPVSYTEFESERRNVTGRFIYESIISKEGLTAIAFVEEPPEGNIRRPRNDNWLPALEHDFSKVDSSTYSEDKYKDMSTFYKIRLCGLVFNTRLYRPKVMFVPEEENIEPGLVRKAVEFLHNEITKNFSDVWMIPCQVEYIPKKVPINRYIVRGKPKDGFFICGDTKNEGFTFVEGILMHKLSSLPIFL